MTHLDRWLTEIADIKDQIAALEERRKELEAKVIERMDATESTSVRFEYNDKERKATLVHSSTMKIDADGLRDELPPRIWKTISKQVVDERALEDQVARGRIDINVVAKHTTEHPRKPYLRMT